MRIPKLPSLYDVDLRKKRVLLRVDFNCPLDNEGKIINDSRIRAHIPTIKELLHRDCSIVIITHQGRPGGKDFTSLEPHVELLRKHLGTDVMFVEDVMGPTAIKSIKSLQPGEVLLLDNVRFVSEEIIEASPETQAKTYLVKRLSPHFDMFIFDAFATAHRSQPSIVGFPMVLPSVMGDLMLRELNALVKVMTASEPPRVFVLGGAKVRDSIKIVEFLTKNKVADRILTTGLVGLTFHVAKGGRVGKSVMRSLEEKGLITLIPRARRVVLSGAPIETPYDYLVLKEDNSVIEEPVHNLSGKAYDIGPYTMAMYSELIKEANVVVMRGPAGLVEDPRFRSGTEKLLKAALSSSAFVVIGGGHLGSMLEDSVREGVHISTGGGALLIFLSGEPLAAIQALELSSKKFFGWSP
jgi:phosphoglycerate kinase